MSDVPAALLGPLGLLIGALLVIHGAVKEWWVSGVAYRRLLVERDLCSAKSDKLAEIAYTNASSARMLAEMQKDLLRNERAADRPGS